MTAMIQVETIAQLCTAAQANAMTLEQVMQQRLRERRQRAAMAAERHRQEMRREFEAGWRRMVELAAAEQTPAELQLYNARRELRKFEALHAPVTHICNEVCKKYGITKDDMTQHNRKVVPRMARFEICYLAEKTTNASLHQIGEVIARDEATVFCSIRRYKQWQRIAAGMETPARKDAKVDFGKVIPAGKDA